MNLAIYVRTAIADSLAKARLRKSGPDFWSGAGARADVLTGG